MTTKKKVVVDTYKKKGQLFWVKEYEGKFYVSHLDDRLGTTTTFEDALDLIKASVDGTVSNIRISDA